MRYSKIKLLMIGSMLMALLGVAMPTRAVTQMPANVVPSGMQVEYTVNASYQSVCDSTNGWTCTMAISVVNANSGADITSQMTSPVSQCQLQSGSIVCSYTQGSGFITSFPIDWKAADGAYNLQFNISYCGVAPTIASLTSPPCSTTIVNASPETISTIVGTESLALRVSASPTTYSKVGDVITYTYLLKNTGTLALGAISVSDDRLGAISGCNNVISSRSGPIFVPLSPGTSTSCTQTYTVVQQDLDAGSLTDGVQASASSLYTSNTIVAKRQSVIVSAVTSSTLQLQITANPETYSAVGDKIVFTYTVTNTGNVDMTNVSVSDVNLRQGISGCTTTLAAGASTSCTEPYIITLDEISVGSLSINGSASATAAAGAAGGTTQVSAVARLIISKAVASGAAPTPIDFTTLPNLNPNEKSLAGALNNLCASSSNATVQAQCTNLYSLTTNQLLTAIAQLVPDQVAAQGANAVETSFTQLSNIRWRLGALHNGSGGTNMFALSGLMLAVNDQSVPVGVLADASSDSNNISNTGRLGGFINGRIQLGNSGMTVNTAGYDFTTKGVTAGIDYRLNDQLVLGGALGYSKNKNDYTSSRGDMNSDGTTVSFYGSYYAPQNMYMDWIASYGSNSYDSNRNIVYSGLSTQTQGNANGKQLGASVSLGSDILRGPWRFTPYLRAEYVEATVDSYTETGGNGFGLSYDKQTVRSFISTIAGRIAKTISARSGVYTPSAHLEWEHQYRNDQRMITAWFNEDPSAPFQVSTDSPDRNYFDIGLGLAATWPGGRSGFITYETVLGQTNIRNYTFDFGVRQEF